MDESVHPLLPVEFNDSPLSLVLLNPYATLSAITAGPAHKSNGGYPPPLPGVLRVPNN